MFFSWPLTTMIKEGDLRVHLFDILGVSTQREMKKSMRFSSRTAVPCSRRLQPQRHGLNVQGKPKYFSTLINALPRITHAQLKATW